MLKEFSGADRSIVDSAKHFATEIIEPHALVWERDGALPREFFLHAAERGLCGLLVPRALGGSEVSNITLAAALAEMAKSCFASTFALIVHNNLASNIARNGGERHQAFLSDMLTGKKIGAFLLTEPGAGSDAAAITTQASSKNETDVLNGEKAWITNGAIADILSIYVQTKANSGPAGIANYLIEINEHPVEKTDRYRLVGANAMNVCGFSFDDVEVSKDALMIEAGQAFKVAMGGIDTARAMVAAMCCGITARALEEAVNYTKQRKAFGRHVADFQTPQHVLADVSTDLEAAHALTERAVIALDEKSGASIAAAHAKKFATAMAMRRVADCMQMMGAVGALDDYPFSRHLGCAKLSQYVDGTSEIQNVVLSRALFAAQ